MLNHVYFFNEEGKSYLAGVDLYKGHKSYCIYIRCDDNGYLEQEFVFADLKPFEDIRVAGLLFDKHKLKILVLLRDYSDYEFYVVDKETGRLVKRDLGIESALGNTKVEYVQCDTNTLVAYPTKFGCLTPLSPPKPIHFYALALIDGKLDITTHKVSDEAVKAISTLGGGVCYFAHTYFKMKNNIEGISFLPNVLAPKEGQEATEEEPFVLPHIHKGLGEAHGTTITDLRALR